MKVIKDTEHSLLLNIFELGGNYYLVTTILTFFDLARPSGLLPEQDLWQTVQDVLGGEAILDEGMPKPRAEVLVVGSCFAPGGSVRNASTVRFRVGRIAKTLSVFGRRFWKRNGEMLPEIAGPEPFKEIPVSYENAFGGSGYEKNPLGLGIDPALTETGETIYPLPFIEDPGHLVGSPADRPDPAGFGPYPAAWPQRSSKLGTYDKKWFQERWPYYPDDMDYTYFNAAPYDQQTDAFFTGDEAIEILNMHPEHQFIQSRLPGKRIRCFQTVVKNNIPGSDENVFREVAPRLDTVWLFPGVTKGIAVYRVTTRVCDDEYSDVIRMFFVTEYMKDTPRNIEYYAGEEKKRSEAEIQIDEKPFKDAEKEMSRAMKLVASIPRKVEEAKARVLGKAPSPKITPREAAEKGAAIMAVSSGMIAETSTRLQNLKSLFGHLVKIDTDFLKNAQNDLKNAASEVNKAAEITEDANKQVDAFKKESIDNAKKKLDEMSGKGIDPELIEKRRSELDTLFMEEKNPWHEKGFDFVITCQHNLMNDQDVMNILLNLGFMDDILEQAWLGINRRKESYEHADWGLEPPRDKPQKRKALVIPKGLVIPHFNGATLDRLTIRPGKVEDYSRDFLVEGSSDVPLFLGFGEGKPVLVVPDELHAWFVYQEAWDICMVTALKEAGQPMDDEIKKRIEAGQGVYIVFPCEKDTDKTAGMDEWLAVFPCAIKLMLPYGETVFEAYRKGYDIRMWILNALPEGLPVRESALAAEKEKEKAGALPAVAFPTLDLEVFRKQTHKEIKETFTPEGNPYDTMKVDDSVMKMKEKLREQGQLTPEMEKHIDETYARMQEVINSAAKVYETGEFPETKEDITRLPDNPYTAMDFSQEFAKLKDKLREQGQLTPEKEQEINNVQAQMMDVVKKSSEWYDKTVQSMDETKKLMQDPIPDWAKKK